ncbi:hypothetical protein [Candidatus Hecatella orcuttiae]|jgi:hypothetical protein|uniref:hypothetical protein n=1 Tax=Candidatus Hecatella orcuttiae TaxID=1935119 RepID=UPI002867BE2F|nr:hypothetical protein [Candidatus Hecatella orcuttiae]
MKNSVLARLLKFPPLVFFLLLILSFTAFQGYVSLVGVGEAEEFPHMEPIVTTDSETYSRDSFVYIHVKVSTHPHEHVHEEEAVVEEHVHEEEAVVEEHVHEEEAVFEGAEVILIIYDPEGNVFADLRGITNQDGEMMFEVYIGADDPTGIYTIIPEASFKGSPIVIGETAYFRVT